MKKNRLLWLCAVLMMVVGMSSCSSEDEFGASGLCHAWYWEDEMPKSYYDLVVYKNNGIFELVAIINTDDGPRKKVMNHGTYHLDGDRLTCSWDGAEETFTYRIVFEKSGEDSFIMYRYSKGEETPSWHNTYYTSERIDDIYRNTPAYSGEW